MLSERIHSRAAFDTVLEGGGQCGALLRAIDWSSHPLGSPMRWPQELRTVVGIALGAKQPMLIVWGPEQIALYNDGYAAICGSRHPAALARPFRQLWFDIWDHVDPIISAAYDGVGTSMEDIAFVMHRNGYPEEAHFSFSYSPVRDCSGAVLGMFCACAETTGQVRLHRRLVKERAQMRHIFERALGAVAIVSGPEHVFTFANHDYQMRVAHRPLLGRRLADALPEVVEQGFVQLLDTVFESGKGHVGRNVESRLQRVPGGNIEKRRVDFILHPISGPDGQVESIFIQANDVTARIDAERQQQMLNHELLHRMKNQLSLVQAVANQTLRSAADLDAARTSLHQRIGVLARAQDMLLAGTADATTVGSILRDVTGLHDNRADRFRIDGPELAAGPRAALSLSLMLHELSTNAAKYGALSVESGCVGIAWRTETTPQGEQFVLDWQETGGPPVVVPDHSGSGTRLLKAGVSGARFSRVDLSYRPSGAHCQIRVDMDGLRS